MFIETRTSHSCILVSDKITELACSNMEIPRLDSGSMDVDTSAKNRVTINVGGIRHETFFSTLANIPDTRLSWLSESSAAFYDVEKKEYFFDRHPGVFSQVLNFYRTGKLHCPTDICGPMFEEELNFWGIDEKQMEPCCWANYTQHREAELNLKAFVGPGFEDLKEEESDDQDSSSSTYRLSRCWQRVRPKMWRFLDEPYSSKRARYASYLSCLFIAVSVITFCVTTIPGVRDSDRLIGTDKRHSVLTEIELVCTIFFTFEFVTRLVLCPSKTYFIKQPMNWIDFMAIWPFFVYYLTGVQEFQMLLVVRVLRLFRFVKLSYGLQIMIQTLRSSIQELFLLLLILLIPVIMFSSIVYYVENFMHNKKTDFDSVPASIWWCLITMTTVGYGDITPGSWGGKVVGGMVAICGILIVALPISVIGSNFSLFYAHAQARLKLPVKQRRLVLGGVPGLISKHNELSSRRIVKKRATIFEHGNQLDMETNWLSSERVFGIAEGVDMSETGTDNERDDEKLTARIPLISPNTAANQKLRGGGVFSDGELNKLNNYQMRRPRRSGLLPLNKLKEEAKRGKESETSSELTDGLPTCPAEDPLKVCSSEEDDYNKTLSDGTIATVSPSTSYIHNGKTSQSSLRRKDSRASSSISSIPGQGKADPEVLGLEGVEVPKIHFTDNKYWDSPTSSNGSVTLTRPENITSNISSLATSTHSMENLNPIASPPSHWRRKSISDSQLCKVFPNMDDYDDTKPNILPREEKQPKPIAKRKPKQKLILPAPRRTSVNGQVCPHNRKRVLSNGNCLWELNGDKKINGRARTVSQPCDISECAKCRSCARDSLADDFLETNI